MNNQMDSNTIMGINKRTVWIGAGVVVLVVILVLIFSGHKKTDSSAALQDQLENSKQLHDVVTSKRNDFKAGDYKLNSGASKIDWTYGKFSGSLPASDGTLSVLSTGRIEGFNVNFNAKDVTSTDTNLISTITGPAYLNVAKFGTASMKASTVLPNTVDNAFTVAFTLDAAGKTTSLASGLYVEHGNGDGIVVRGDVYLDPKSVGFSDSKDNLKLSPHYEFEK